MHPNYHPETVVRAMGLLGFETDPDPVESTEWIRLLFRPSFDPEVCVTIRSGDAAGAAGDLSVLAARSMVWRAPETAGVMSDRSDAPLAAEDFAKVRAWVDEAVAASASAPRIVLDGIRTDILRFEKGGKTHRTSFAETGASASGRPLRRILEFARGLVESRCREALVRIEGCFGRAAETGAESGAKLPSGRLLLLGAENDRQDLQRALWR